ncbi:MAG: DUF995 domain-containing protein [Gammaproteobacteria bacterium]|nr:MAG: DUF995 domain-containing protein [Gammaproteobacteria bacterium]
MSRGCALALVVGSLLLSGCQTMPVGQSERLLSSDEVEALFGGKTVESYNLNTRLTSFTFYRPDGHVLQQRFWSWRSGSWRVTPEGKICLKFKRERCRHILAQGERYTKIKRKKGHRVKLVRYRQFLDGNRLSPPNGGWPRSTRFVP